MSRHQLYSHGLEPSCRFDWYGQLVDGFSPGQGISTPYHEHYFTTHRLGVLWAQEGCRQPVHATRTDPLYINVTGLGADLGTGKYRPPMFSDAPPCIELTDGVPAIHGGKAFAGKTHSCFRMDTRKVEADQRLLVAEKVSRAVDLGKHREFRQATSGALVWCAGTDPFDVDSPKRVHPDFINAVTYYTAKVISEIEYKRIYTGSDPIPKADKHGWITYSYSSHTSA